MDANPAERDDFRTILKILPSCDDQFGAGCTVCIEGLEFGLYVLKSVSRSLCGSYQLLDTALEHTINNIQQKGIKLLFFMGQFDGSSQREKEIEWDSFFQFSLNIEVDNTDLPIPTLFLEQILCTLRRLQVEVVQCSYAWPAMLSYCGRGASSGSLSKCCFGGSKG
jgi:hypothetical protein